MLFPALVGLLVFVVGPAVVALLVAGTDTHLSGSHRWVGTANLREAFHDRGFGRSVVNTFEYCLLTVPPSVLLGLALALAASRVTRGGTALRLALFLPLTANLLAVSVVFAYMFDPSPQGLANTVAGWFGVAPQAWLGSPATALPVVALVGAWHLTSLAFLVYLAGLTAIPPEVYEATRIDGIRGCARLRQVTLPLLAPTTVFLTIITTVVTLQAFDTVRVLTAGGPLESSATVTYFIYEVGARGSYRVGYASALSLLVLLASVLINLAGMYLVRFTRPSGRQASDRGSAPVWHGSTSRPPELVIATENGPAPEWLRGDATEAPSAGNSTGLLGGPVRAASGDWPHRWLRRPARRGGDKMSRRGAGRTGGRLILLAGTLFALLPFVWMVRTAFSPAQSQFALTSNPIPSAWTLGGFLRAFQDADLGRAMVTGIGVSVAILALQLATAIPAAYVFSWVPFRGRNLLFAFILGTLLIPSQLTAIPNYVTISTLGIADTHIGLVLPFMTSASAIFLLRQHMMTIPTAMMEAVRLDGLGHFRTLRAIVIPMIAPAIATVSVLSFLLSFNEYLWPLLVVHSPDLNTPPLALVHLYAAPANGWRDYTELCAGAVMISLPTILLFFIAQRYLIAGLSGIRAMG